jgi:hypothetical protein
MHYELKMHRREVELYLRINTYKKRSNFKDAKEGNKRSVTD